MDVFNEAYYGLGKRGRKKDEPNKNGKCVVIKASSEDIERELDKYRGKTYGNNLIEVNRSLKEVKARYKKVSP